MRARSGKTVIRKRKRLRVLTKGYRAGRHTLWRQSKVTHIRAGVFAFRDRRAKKRTFRSLWIVRVSAACKQRSVRYSAFIAALNAASIQLDRKMLSEIAIHDPKAFDEIVATVREFLPRVAKSA